MVITEYEYTKLHYLSAHRTQTLRASPDGLERLERFEPLEPFSAAERSALSFFESKKPFRVLIVDLFFINFLDEMPFRPSPSAVRKALSAEGSSAMPYPRS